MPEVLNRRDFPGRLPPRTKYCGRGTPFGNRFVLGVDGNRDEVIAKFRAEKEQDPDFIAKVKAELRGWNLMCHCKPKACHCDWLCEVANS